MIIIRIGIILLVGGVVGLLAVPLLPQEAKGWLSTWQSAPTFREPDQGPGPDSHVSPSDGVPPTTSAPKPVSALKVTDVWGQFSVFGGIIYFELAATSKAEVGLVCKLEMWSGAKLYETQTVTLSSKDLKRGQTLEVSFAVDADDKIMALVQPEDTRMKDVVDL